MWTDKGVSIILLSACIIVLIPFVFQFTNVMVKYLINKYLSREDLYVTYKENGQVVSRIKISYKQDGSVSIQRETIRGKNGH